MPISSSSNGVNLISGAYAEYLYTSTNSGSTWTAISSSGSLSLTNDWSSSAMSSDGKYIAMGTSNTGSSGGGYIYTSSDFGATWVE